MIIYVVASYHTTCFENHTVTMPCDALSLHNAFSHIMLEMILVIVVYVHIVILDMGVGKD